MSDPNAAPAHTPGPWSVGWNGGLSGPRVGWRVFLDSREIKDVTQVPISAGKTAVAWVMCAQAHPSHDFVQADSHLIAAAPDLLTALRNFTNAAQSWHDTHNHAGSPVQCDWLCECIPAGKAAIAKAEGRS